MQTISGGSMQITASGTFAAHLDLDDAVGHTLNPGLQRLRSKCGGSHNHSEKSLTSALERWRQGMNNMSQYDCMH